MKTIAFLFLMAACGQAVTPGGAAPDTCGKNGYATLVGTALAATSLPSDLNARIIPPDTAVTLDFFPTRLNIFTDAAGIITRISCG